MNILFKKSILLILPFCALLSFPIFIYYTSGEFVPFSVILKKQLEENKTKELVYGPAYSDQTLYHKSQMASRINPDVLALGNSKILTMRKEFFKPSVRFYNAGGTVSEIASFRKFLIQTKIKPKVIYITVEPLHFDSSLVVDTRFNPQKFESISEVTRVGNMISRNWSKVYSDYLLHKFSVKDIIHPKDTFETMGLQARITGSGTRRDGSYHYGRQYEDEGERDKKIERAVQFIASKKTQNTEGAFSSEALTELDAFLQYCRDENIYVVGYVPPTPKSIENEYKKHTQYRYMQKVYEKTNPIFAKYGFKVFDFYSLQSLNSNDSETIDEYHTSEKVMVRTLISISKKDDITAKIVNMSVLEKAFRSTQDQNDVLK